MNIVLNDVKMGIKNNDLLSKVVVICGGEGGIRTLAPEIPDLHP